MDLGLRARAALALSAVLAYNPLQPRGPDGRWIKAGAGVAVPSTPAKKAARRPAIKKATPARATGAASWLEEAKTGKLSAATEERIKQAFAFKDPQTGMSTEAYQIEASPTGRVVANINILDSEGRTVGKAVRNVDIDKKTGEPYVYHTSFNLGKRAQGGGFSSRWLAQMEDRYREQGIKQIRLTTNDVGGYAWAKAGFDFADRKEARVAASALTKLLNKRSVRDRLSQRQITDGQALIKRVLTPGEELPTPAEFAMLGWMPGLDSWIGKETMLGTGWHGVKEL